LSILDSDNRLIINKGDNIMKKNQTSNNTSAPKLKFYNSVESSNNKSVLSVGMAGRCSSSTTTTCAVTVKLN
jgi:hypothetical protein